jgi:hypothetical protein
MRKQSLISIAFLFLSACSGDSGGTTAESESDESSSVENGDDDDDDDDDDESTSETPSEDEETSASSDDDDDDDDDDETTTTTSEDDDDDETTLTSDDDDDNETTATSGDDDDDTTTTSDDDDDETSSDDTTTDDEPFSFFVTSLARMRELSGSEDGFGGNLGGLEGADKICQDIATAVGAGHKEWRAFLSVTKGPDGNPVNAIDRIGEGPWYDRNGAVLALNKAGLLSDRPTGGDPALAQDLTDEDGVPLTEFGDSHDVLTATNKQGMLIENDLAATCQDWTSSEAGEPRKVMCGHAWPAGSGKNWMQAHPVPGCEPGVNLIQDGPGMGSCVGCGGGWGGIYCFALTP